MNAPAPVPTILVATDFSDVADRALEAAGALAETLGAQVMLVHSHDGAADAAFGDPPGATFPGAVGPRGVDAVNLAAALETRARRLPAAVGVRVKILAGRPAWAIVDEARRCGAELIVLGTHGRGPLGRALRGSVAHEVLREAHAPVLLLGPRRAA